MTDRSDALGVVGLRLLDGRTGSTSLMQLLATSPEIVFDEAYPAEYRCLSYVVRMAELMTVMVLRLPGRSDDGEMNRLMRRSSSRPPSATRPPRTAP